MPSSGSMTSPLPESMKVPLVSATDQQSFQVAARAGPCATPWPVPRRILQIAGMLLQLAFKTFEQSDGVGGRSRKTSDDFIVVQDDASCAQCVSSRDRPWLPAHRQ